jgi:phosphoadenosine phosphosulfate reductase
MGINRYITFGLRRSWLVGFLEGLEEWLKENSLGPEQKVAMNRYLKDACLIDRQQRPTPLAKVLLPFVYDSEETLWQVVWFNLCRNSSLFGWYAKAVPFGKEWEKSILIQRLAQEHSLKERTACNAINALTNTFEESPLGEWFGKRVKRGVYLKKGVENIKPCAFAYAIYTLGPERRGELINIFGVSPDYIESLMGAMVVDKLLEVVDGKVRLLSGLKAEEVLRLCKD